MLIGQVMDGLVFVLAMILILRAKRVAQRGDESLVMVFFKLVVVVAR